MDIKMSGLKKIVQAYRLPWSDCHIAALGSGLINHTWKVDCNNSHYILQQINDHVFKNPPDIAHNMEAVGNYLQQQFPGYLFVMPLQAASGEYLVQDEEGSHYRLMPFVPGSHTIDTVQRPQQAYEAAFRFGEFTRLLSNFDSDQLRITLPQFHDLGLRYRQFTDALRNGDPQRMRQSSKLVEELQENRFIADEFEEIKNNMRCRLRATHHDTKISNVLFDGSDKSLCVIDLDTLMPGYFISDVGDMLRTYLSPVSEEESDLSRIVIRDEYFAAVVEGYLGQMHDILTEDEKARFVYAGKFMIYMQALRFLTDHLNNDIYYGARYEGHNYSRAANQLMLLRRLKEKEPQLQALVAAFGVPARRW